MSPKNNMCGWMDQIGLNGMDGSLDEVMYGAPGGADKTKINLNDWPESFARPFVFRTWTHEEPS